MLSFKAPTGISTERRRSAGQRTALGLANHVRQNVRDINVTFEFGIFIGCPNALVRFVHQFLHSRAIGSAEINGHKITGCLGKLALSASGSAEPR
jgi:hypothetical protein